MATTNRDMTRATIFALIAVTALLVAYFRRLTHPLLLSLTVGPVGLVFPRLVRPIFVGWMIAAFPIGWTVGRISLALLFFIVFTPVSLLFRLRGRDALALRRPARESHWVPLPRAVAAGRYLKQY
jgi:hypothetical protein